MAETVLYNTLTEILMKLGSAVVQEIGLAWGLKHELHKLENSVSTIRAVLVDAEEQQATNQGIADWLEKLNDAVYDADDLFDDFSTQVLRCQVMTQNKRLKKVRVFFSSSNQLAFSFEMIYKIKAIKARLYEIARDRTKFHLIERPIQMRAENSKRGETHSSVIAESVIGRDDDKNNIVEMLLDSKIQENVSAVAIVGIGGLGKTTLAQLVYNDERVTRHFEIKMWVCISDVFDVKLIVEKAIESATSEKSQNVSIDELQQKFSKEIDGKKYLLVLDDLWNENRERWLELRVLLMGGSRGSKILVTTRSELVANVMDANSPHLLKGLSEEESWSLFKQMAFKHGEESENMRRRVTIGKDIVHKCKGVPLAIRAIGSLLYSKDTYAEWLLFKSNDLAKIAQVEDVILPILKLSYDYLPSNLKRCFAICSLYLKAEEIDKQELIQLWIAHGFIESVYENQQLEDVGDLYFMDLLRRSFFQDVERNECGDIISCKMHDLVHDVAQLVARLENSILNSDANAKTVIKRTRHVSFGYRVDSSWEVPSHLVRASKLRTFILKDQDLKETVFEKIVSTFKSLRVLDLSQSGMKTVPNNIGELKHLRYLDFSNNTFKTLPNSITKLQNLQTLKLNKCSLLEELPRAIRKLVSLRHLELNECPRLTGMPFGLGHLTSLLTLTRFVVGSNSSGLSELQNLNNLRRMLCIEIRGHKDSSTRCCLKNATRMEGGNYLEAKEYLETLNLDFERIDAEDDDELLLDSLRPHPNLKELKIECYGGVSFPSWMMMVDKIGLSLPNLVRIYLKKCHRCKHLSLFGQLPSLQFLTLENMKSLEYIDNCSSGSGSGGEESLSSSLPSSSYSSSGGGATQTFFPSLKELQLKQLWNLKGWWRSEAVEEEATTMTTTTTTLLDQQQHLKKSLPCCLPSFPSLSKLTIQHCPNLVSMPILQPCLEELCLFRVSKKLVEQELMMTVSPTPRISMSSSSSSSSLLHLSKLKSLDLEYIEDLVTLPECIGNLTSLELLYIHNCPNLTSLPDGMRRLVALQHLTITACAGILYSRCQRNTGEDWAKIAHIPYLYRYRLGGGRNQVFWGSLTSI